MYKHNLKEQTEHSYVILTDGEWSGLYIDGELDTHGDHYLAQDRLLDIFNIESVHNGYWVIDGHQVVQSLSEVMERKAAAEAAQATAAALRAQAAKLIEQAKVLEDS